MNNDLLSETNCKKIEAKISAIEERQQYKNNLLSSEGSAAFKAMVVGVVQNVTEEHRLKGRQAGAGRPSILDEETMEIVVPALESECNTERRRRDAAMYCDKSRKKESDLLDIAKKKKRNQP